jgi:hypothetical protein
MSTCESQPAAGGRWENDIAQVHARVHNDHTFIGHRYVDDTPGLGPAQLDFLETLIFDHMESRIANIGTALKDTCCWFFETPECIRWRDRCGYNHHHRILWVKSKAASDKSIMINCAFEHAEGKRRGNAVVSFFFNA